MVLSPRDPIPGAGSALTCTGSGRGKTFIIHHATQVESWPETLVRGESNKHSNARRTDTRRLSALDALLRGYIIGRRATNAVVTHAECLKQANLFLQDAETRAQCKDKASVQLGYIIKFMKRCSFTVKAVKKRTAFTAVEIAERGQKLHTMVYRCLPHVEAVVNFDEVPGSLAGVMGKLKTITEVSDIDVRAYVNASAFKRCCTVVAFGCVVRDGLWKRLQLKPIILYRGEPGPTLLAEQYDDRCIVTWTKKAVMTQACFTKVIVPAIRDQLTAAGVGRALLVLDCCTSHLTAVGANTCWAAKLPTAVIPAGATSWLQWVDTHFAFAYRAYHSKAFQPYAGLKLTASQKRRLIARIVCEAHAHCSRNVVRDFALLGYTDPAAAVIRGVPEYTFQVPQLPEDEVQADEVKMQERIARAVAEMAQAPAAVPAKKAVGRPPLRDQPVKGYKDIRTFFAPRPPPASQQQ